MMTKVSISSIILAACVQAAATMALAQIVTDGTAGPALSIGGPDHVIADTLGRRAGNNLFHSFSQFDVATGARATFTGPDDLRAVISRVTGSGPSVIDGTLRSTIAAADMFFINPHGILFGPSAALDIDGSFHAASADHIGFADGTIYSAVDLSASTFSVAAPASFGFLDGNNGGIGVFGSALPLPASTTMTLASRDLSVNFGLIEILNGTVNLFGVGPSGTTSIAGVAQTAAAAGFDGNISLSGSLIEVSGAGNETVTIQSGQVEISDTVIFADTLFAFDASEKGGGVRITGRDSVAIQDQSSVLSGTFSVAASGDIVVDTKDFLIDGDSTFDTVTFADGNAGNISITATGQALIDRAFLASDADFGSTGNAGMVTVATPILEMVGGGISSNTRSVGQGGTVRLDVGSLAGSLDGSIAAGTFGDGDAGAVIIDATGGDLAAAGAISLTDDFTITGTAFPFSSGAAGRVTVKASTLDMSGGLIFSSTSGVGQGGQVDVDVARLSMRTLAKIDSSTFGPGDAGNITVKASESISVADEAAITTTTLSFTGAAAGRISVATPRLAMTGGFISATSFGTGAGGAVSVDVGDLALSGASEISTDAFAVGEAGGIVVSAVRSVSLEGDADPKITSRTSPGSSGNAGSISIDAQTLSLAGGLVGTESAGSGRGGSIAIAVDRAIIGTGGTVTASATDQDAGDIRIQVTNALDLAGDGSISSSMLEGAGAGGTVTLDVKDLTMADASGISAITTGAGDGGDITIRATDTVTVTDNALIAADQRARADGSSTIANAGSVSVSARLLVVDEAGAITATTVDGGGGDIVVDAGSIIVADAGRIGSSSRGTGFAGSLLIRASDKLQLLGGEITAEAFEGNGGNITVEVGNLVELRGAKITTTVLNSIGNGGNIDVDPVFIVMVDSRIIANAFAGTGGNIQLTADNLLIDGASIISASSALGIAGTVVIEAPDADVTSALSTLNGDFLNAASQLAQQCAARGGQTAATLTAAGRGALPANPNTVQNANYFVAAPDMTGAYEADNARTVAVVAEPVAITLRCSA